MQRCRQHPAYSAGSRAPRSGLRTGKRRCQHPGYAATGAGCRRLRYPAWNRGRCRHRVFWRLRPYAPEPEGGVFLPRQKPPSAAGSGKRHAVLRLQSAGARLCQRLGKRGTGQLCGLPPPRPTGTAVVGAGSDGGAAPLYGRPLCADPREQSDAAPGGLSDAGQRRGAAVR